MSYGRSKHDSGAGDRDRDPNSTDMNTSSDNNGPKRNDRNFNGRQGNSQRKFPLPHASVGDHPSASNSESNAGLNQGSDQGYQREESRDFHGYRGGYRQPDSGGSSLNGSSRRRDRNLLFHAYLGHKYRPHSAKPKGPSQGQNQGKPVESISFRGLLNNSGTNPRYDGSAHELSLRDHIEKAGAHSLKQDWTSASTHKHRNPTLHQAQGSQNAQKQLNRVYKGHVAPKPAKFEFKRGSIGDAKGLRSESERSRQGPPKEVPLPLANNTSDKKARPPTDFAKNHAQNHAQSDAQSDAKKAVKKRPASLEHEDKSSTLSDIELILSEKKLELQDLFDDGKDPLLHRKDIADDHGLDESSDEDNMDIDGTNVSGLDSKTKDMEHQNAHDVSGSPPNGFDTSVLSPVGSTAPDEALARNLNIVSETKTAGLDSPSAEIEENGENGKDGDLSEADTVAEDDIDMARSRLFLRERAKKHNRIFSDDEETLLVEEYVDHADKPVLSLEARAHRDRYRFAKDPKEETPVNPAPAPSKQESSPEENKPKAEAQKTYKIKRDFTGRSQLQRACKKGDFQEAERLIAKGASANESDFGGFTCLHEAALAGHTEIVELLIKHGAEVNKQALEAGDCETPLIDAAENKHVGVVKVLLKHGADPHLCNNEGYSTITKLFHLQEDDEDYEDMVKVINDFSPPQVNSELSKVTHVPRTIIDDPNECYFSELVKKSQSLIYKYAAQGNKESVAEDFVTHGFTLLKMPDVLNLAARNGHVELVDILLGLNPGSFDINHVNKIGVTVLLATVGRGFYDVVKFLLSKGADPRLKRAEDGMSALEIAKHSAQYDPREVVVLEESMNDDCSLESREKNGKNSAESVFEDQLKDDDSRNKTLQTLREPRLEKSELKLVAAKKEAAPFHEVPPVIEAASDGKSVSSEATEKCDASNEKGAGDNLSAAMRSASKRKISADDSHLHKKARKNSPANDPHEHSTESKAKPGSENEDPKKETAPHLSVDTHSFPVYETLKLPTSMPELSSTDPSSKAQEEQRIRAGEQAKIWQEKMQAKKQARKEMFLLAEKEKEKRRKQDEEKRLELLKRQEHEQKEQLKREEIEAQKLAEEVETKKQIMERQCIFQRYPIGLQEAVFDGTFTREERTKYTPLYVFSMDGENWVIDMQVSLILSVPVSEVHSHLENELGPQIDDASKDKLWSLFFKMIGVGKNNVIERNGVEKFRCLQLQYVKLSDVGNWVKLQAAEAYKLLWDENRLTEVDLGSLDAAQARDSKKTNMVNVKMPRADVGFIPPKFRHRGDVLSTIQAARFPLWPYSKKSIIQQSLKCTSLYQFSSFHVLTETPYQKVLKITFSSLISKASLYNMENLVTGDGFEDGCKNGQYWMSVILDFTQIDAKRNKGSHNVEIQCTEDAQGKPMKTSIFSATFLRNVHVTGFGPACEMNTASIHMGAFKVQKP